jgi:hypothetical protein
MGMETSKILDLEYPHICHLADGFVSWHCGELQFEQWNTTKPIYQVSSFKVSLFKSSYSNSNQNSVLHTINWRQQESL